LNHKELIRKILSIDGFVKLLNYKVDILEYRKDSNINIIHCNFECDFDVDIPECFEYFKVTAPQHILGRLSNPNNILIETHISVTEQGLNIINFYKISLI